MIDMNTIALRLKFLREGKGWTQTQLAVAADVSQGTVGNIESGARAGRGSLIKLAKALDASLDWLIDGIGEPHQKTIREPSSIQGAVTEIPLLNKDIAGMYQQYLDGTTPPPETHYHPSNGKGLFAFSVDDDLMEPRVPKGCRAIISTRIKPRHGMCVLVSDGQTSYIRKLTIDGGSQYLEATNTKMPARPLTGTIIGVVHQVSILFVDLFEGEEE